MEIEEKKSNVILICGADRSGSTLLDLMLGQIDGFFSTGELRHIWGRGWMENQLCGCGRKFLECKFWGKVAEDAFGSFQAMDLREIKDLWTSVDHGRYIPTLISRWNLGSQGKKQVRYAQLLSRLYRSIHKVSGKSVIIDSSKKPSHGFILNASPHIDLRIIHLIRDSRAVAYSYQRAKLRPEIYWKEEYLPLQRPTKIAAYWNVRNYLAHMITHVNNKFTRLRYEDLVSNPQMALSKALTQLGERTPYLQHLDGLRANPGVMHTVSGNPIRFQQGTLEIRPDTEWEKKMPKRQKMLITALTWPFLLRYGYLQTNKD